ncbi:Glycoside hydrolase family 57 [Candidatus Zixiibacteriota bacterium]|nr:Glycoside hydrolase family 57 [candidate division Zixibacteria bacterium]
MSKFKLAIGLHNHQPVGNFDSVFEQAHRDAYAPFLNLLDNFENIRLSLHQSGILWDWQEKHHPEYLALTKKLVNRGQIELMTGGFYEPILPSIPDRDKLGQIALLSDYLKRHFGCDCTGFWLAERVWEPHLPKVLHRAGVNYLPVDDTHFLYAGLERDDLKGIFITEEEGYAVKLLPIQKKLRYLIPFGTVDKVIDELKRQADRNGGGMAIYADDGEKFGVWPKTHQHCYDDHWLNDFFDALLRNSDWLEIITLGEAAQTEPVGRVYLPTASYEEMLHWSLPAKAFVEYEEFETWLKSQDKFEKYGRYVRGGHWRGFLAKYEEANLMHKRMMAVSEQLEKFTAAHPHETDRIARARHHLYAGQCNCPYWHGVFGGLYLPHLRQAIFENLIQAENLIKDDNDNATERRQYDYDCDGKDDITISTNKFAAWFKPASGGMLVELDSRAASFNLTDTLKRRREGYHRKLANAHIEGQEKVKDGTASIHDLVLTKEAGLEKLLAEDWYLRRCFIDHFLSQDTDIQTFLSGDFGDEGDFVNTPYQYYGSVDKGVVAFRRTGQLWRPDGAKAVAVEKRFYFAPDSDVISVNYALTAPNDDLFDVRLAVENNFNFQAGHAHDRYPLYGGSRPGGSFLDSVIQQSQCQNVTLRDDWRKIAVALTCDKECDIWQVPIFTISLSEAGFEKVYQGTSLLNVFRLNLRRGIPLELTFMLFAGSTADMPNRFAGIGAGALH